MHAEASTPQRFIDVFRLGLPPYAYQQLKQLAGSKMTSGGELIAKAHERQAKRVKTKPSKAAKARRVDEKKGRSAVKAGRGKVQIDSRQTVRDRCMRSTLPMDRRPSFTATCMLRLCDAASRSELVVPIIHGGTLLGVLDLDSPLPDRFDAEMRPDAKR